MGGCSRYIMGRRKKALRKLVKKSNKSISTLKTGCVSASIADRCEGHSHAVPSAKEASLSITGDCEEEPMTLLDLTVTYDYTCDDKKTIDPLNSMEELSGVFSFKDTLQPDTPVALWGDFNSQPPLAKKMRTAPFHPKNYPHLRCLVSTIDELKETTRLSKGENNDSANECCSVKDGGCSSVGCLLHHTTQKNYPGHQEKAVESDDLERKVTDQEENQQGIVKDLEGVMEDQEARVGSQEGLVEKQELKVGDWKGKMGYQEGIVEERIVEGDKRAIDGDGEESDLAMKENSEDGDFWEAAAALVLSQELEQLDPNDVWDQSVSCSLNTLYQDQGDQDQVILCTLQHPLCHGQGVSCHDRLGQGATCSDRLGGQGATCSDGLSQRASSSGRLSQGASCSDGLGQVTSFSDRLSQGASCSDRMSQGALCSARLDQGVNFLDADTNHGNAPASWIKSKNSFDGPSASECSCHQYTTHQIELKRLKAIHLRSHRAKKYK